MVYTSYVTYVHVQYMLCYISGLCTCSTCYNTYQAYVQFMQCYISGLCTVHAVLLCTVLAVLLCTVHIMLHIMYSVLSALSVRVHVCCSVSSAITVRVCYILYSAWRTAVCYIHCLSLHTGPAGWCGLCCVPYLRISHCDWAGEFQFRYERKLFIDILFYRCSFRSALHIALN